MRARDGNSATQTCWNERAAFTLTELLVILAVLAVLACLGSAALAGDQGRTRIVECASHLRQYDLTVQLYANEHQDFLPAPTLNPPLYRAPGNWPWDEPVQVINQLAPYGMTRNVYYCPANESLNNDDAWNFGVGGDSGGFRITGYLAAFKYTRQIPPQYLNAATLTPQSYTNSQGVLVPAPLPSQRMLLADMTLSYNGRYDQIPYGGVPTSFTFRTSHMVGDFPAGGNEAMLDGHVEWREFSDMKVAVGVPTFHW